MRRSSGGKPASVLATLPAEPGSLIRRKAFSHGWWYHYRVHEERLASLCAGSLAPLGEYLRGLFASCPDEKFLVGGRGSRLRFSLATPLLVVEDHEVCRFARSARGPRSPHTNVEVAMLCGDGKSVAVEVPLWLDAGEDSFLERLAPLPLSGHVDVLRVEEGRVWVWDYKPRAARERWAAAQVWSYAVMLSTRTSIPLDSFGCGWFDEEVAFLFLPERAFVSRASFAEGFSPRGW